MRYAPRGLKWFEYESFQEADITSEGIANHLFKFINEADHELKEKNISCDSYDLIYKAGSTDVAMSLTFLVFGDATGLIICELSPNTEARLLNPSEIRKILYNLEEESNKINVIPKNV